MALTRNLARAMVQALQNRHFHPVLMVKAHWPTGVYRFHTGIGRMAFEGADWLGWSYASGGDLVSIGQISLGAEEIGVVPMSASIRFALTLEGALALQSEYQRGLRVSIYAGLTTQPAGVQLIDSPSLVFSGSTIGNRVADIADQSALEIVLKSGPPARAAASLAHSTELQQKEYPGDTFFDRAAHGTKFTAPR